MSIANGAHLTLTSVEFPTIFSVTVPAVLSKVACAFPPADHGTQLAVVSVTVVTTGPAKVVAETAAVWAEQLPDASQADAVYEYVVAAVNPMSLKPTVTDVPTCVPFRKNLYTDTAVLSVDPVKAKLIWVCETGVAVRFVGTVGGVVSGAEPVVKAQTLVSMVTPALFFKPDNVTATELNPEKLLVGVKLTPALPKADTVPVTAIPRTTVKDELLMLTGSMS